MSAYNSENTTILATHDEGGNKRMLLLHRCESGRLEYVIGSYFTTEIRVIDSEGHTKADYSWDWGHYFSDVVSAAEHWKEVIGFDSEEVG